jgi:hypothetical protein
MSQCTPISARIACFAVLVAYLPCATLWAEPSTSTETSSPPLAATGSIPVQAASLNSGNRSAKPWTLPKEHHPWARFSEGAWREIEVITETFDEEGKLFGQSFTVQKEILKAVTEDSYVLDVQATVDVSGKRIAGPWNTRVLRLATDRGGAVFAANRHADEQLPLNVGAVNCQVWEVQYTEEGRNLFDRLFYSPDVYPHVLRRDVIENVENSPSEAPTLDAALVTTRFVPFSWEGRIIECTQHETIHHREKGNSQNVALLTPEVPGGEIQSHSTDFDSSGRRIRWSIQKLVGFGVSPSSNAVAEPAVSRVPNGQGQK